VCRPEIVRLSIILCQIFWQLEWQSRHNAGINTGMATDPEVVFMPEPDWRRIAGPGSHEIEIKKSRFICTMTRVTSDEEARSFIAAMKKEHWEANHNCSAYSIGESAGIQRSSDDGEPSGTAGIPMLDVLRKSMLTDTVAVVTRYFGGTLLGAGGLIRAYGRAVSETIREIGIVARQQLTVMTMVADHAEAGRLHNALASSGFPEATVTYEANGVRFQLHLAEPDIAPFEQWLAETTNGQVVATVQGHVNIDVPVLPET
jgi:uncharacterized YigZ family protein